MKPAFVKNSTLNCHYERITMVNNPVAQISSDNRMNDVVHPSGIGHAGKEVLSKTILVQNILFIIEVRHKCCKLFLDISITLGNNARTNVAIINRNRVFLLKQAANERLSATYTSCNTKANHSSSATDSKR